MGAGLSTEAAADATMPPMAQVTLQTVATLPRLVAICSATQTLAPSDALWADLLAFEIDLPGDDESPRALSMTENGELELALAPLASELVSHNLETRNLGNLILLLLTHVRILGDIPVAATPGIRAGLYQRTLNAVLLLRVFVKHLFETLPPRIALRHFSAHTASVAASLQTSQRAGMSASADEIDLKEQLVLSLVQLLVDTPSTPDYLSTEAINLMTVLLSLQLYLPTIEANDFLMHVMTGACRQRAHQLLGRLLTRFADHAAPSKPSQLKAPGAASYSLIPWRSQPNATLTPEERAVHVEALNREDVASDPGAEASLLLLLLLCNHGVRKPGGNPFQAALSTFRDSAQDFSVSESGRPPLGVVQLSYTKLYSVLCQRLHNQQTTLLLYLLLHANTSFTTFLLSRTDLQNVLIPMLQTLYNAASQPSQQIYMLLIIVLILSQDHSFNKGIHEQSLPSVPWYTEKTIHQISLGSLIVIVLARTIQYNLAKLKDLYMNTNCLAALANMSPHFHALHQYAAERIVGLFLLLSKRFETLKKAASSSSESENADVDVFADFLRIVLEIMNSSLLHAMQRNPYLVYMLLREREHLNKYASEDRFADVVSNIETILDYFSASLEPHLQTSPSAEDVLGLIAAAAQKWNNAKLQSNELKFKYEEEEQPDDFFIPYTWSIVVSRALIKWRASPDGASSPDASTAP